MAAVYTLIARNGTDRKERRLLVVRESYESARGDLPPELLHNPFWQLKAIEAASLADFYDALDAFDWYHAYSDDHRVHRQGEQRRAELQRAARLLGPAAAELFDRFQAHKSPEGGPKPERPI